jgi:SAM-dependent methyltransferase
VACGTGRHLASFLRHFECAGTDLEPEMVAIARETLPGVPVERADMVELDLGRSFDAITCLFSSIGYTVLPARLDRAVRAMAGHLNPGGVLVVEPWITPDAWIGSGSDTVDTVEHNGGTLVRVISSRREGDETLLRMHYVRAARGEIETEDEHHRLGLFSQDRYLEAFASAGLSAAWHDPGLRNRGLVVGQASTARPRSSLATTS